MASRGFSVIRDDEQVVNMPGVPTGTELPDLPGALCAQVDPELWFPDRGGSAREAKAVCGRCPARAACLEWALEAGEQFGIWGGLTAWERRQLRSEPAPTSKEPRGTGGEAA